MTWRTHALIGIDALWLVAPLPGVLTGPGAANPGLLAACAALGALLPDLEAAQSKAAHLSPGWGLEPFALPSLILHRAFGHRGVMHSLLGLVGFGLLVCLPLSRWWGWAPSLALWAGYASHIAADACTRTGVPLFWPDRRRRFLLPAPLRLTTGSPSEEALLPLLAALALLLLVTVLNGSYS